MCLNDFDCDGKMEVCCLLMSFRRDFKALFIKILVGSEDFEIRVFKGDAILDEITETEVHMSNVRFIAS